MTNGGSDSKMFLGMGLAFPIDLDGEGRLTLNSYEDHVHQSILVILQTEKGERVMLPNFGAGLQSIVFEPVASSTIALVQHQVQQALVRNEPRIDVLNVQVTTDAGQSGVLTIQVSYRVRRTDTIFNVVYPFFIERGGL